MSEKPNILLVMSDQHNANCVGVFTRTDSGA